MAILGHVKLKRLPEDFQVEELTEFAPTGSGDFASYRLTKRSLGTPEAVEAVARRWKLDHSHISYGGLKDRHAVTTQFLTIRRGPRRDLRQTNLELKYLGQSPQPFGPRMITGNRFRIVMRAVNPAGIAAAETAIAEIQRDGLPNYFDDQRFGSLGESGEFVARAWIAGDYERALWLALAEANPLDRPRDRVEKRLLREHWGDWPTCREALTRSRRGDIASHLCERPGDFRGAWARLHPNLRSLYLSAFQSFLWNRLLAEFLRQHCAPEQLVPVRLKMGDSPFIRWVGDDVRSQLHHAELPLPSSRVRLDEGPIHRLVDRTLAELGLSLRQIRVKYPRDSFFSKGWRRAMFAVSQLAHEAACDELYEGCQKLSVSFDLPRGSYATIFIKRVIVAPGMSAGPALDLLSEGHEQEAEANI